MSGKAGWAPKPRFNDPKKLIKDKIKEYKNFMRNPCPMTSFDYRRQRENILGCVNAARWIAGLPVFDRFYEEHFTQYTEDFRNECRQLIAVPGLADFVLNFVRDTSLIAHMSLWQESDRCDSNTRDIVYKWQEMV